MEWYSDVQWVYSRYQNLHSNALGDKHISENKFKHRFEKRSIFIQITQGTMSEDMFMDIYWILICFRKYISIVIRKIAHQVLYKIKQRKPHCTKLNKTNPILQVF